MSASTRPRTVLVTGAARRLGRETALALARAGWQVAVHYRDSRDDALQTQADCACIAGSSSVFESDFSYFYFFCDLVTRVVAHFGRLDAVVNSASLFEHDEVADFGYETLDRHMRSNTAAAILLAQALHAHVSARAAGGEAGVNAAVVNLLDQKLWNNNPDFLSYTLSKAALEAATTMLALALAPLVRVVGVAPGLTLSILLLNHERFEQLHGLSPLGRSSTSEDVAAAIRFVLDNRSMTGTTVLVDGGQHLQRFERDFSMM